MADFDGNIDVEKVAKFWPTMELRYRVTSNYIPSLDCHEEVLQQKWVNELGNKKWLDVPSVILDD